MIKDKYITETEEGKYFLMIPLRSKKYEASIIEAEQVANDILNCIAVTERWANSGDESLEKSPNFMKAIKRISKSIWRIL